MISIRYHLLSLVAVFLALGIGIALGTTLIQRATVDTLQSRLDDQEERLKANETENAELTERVEGLDGEAEAIAAGVTRRLLDDRLAETAVLAVTAWGTAPETYERIDSIMADSGARFAGTITIEPRLELEADGDRIELAGLIEDVTVTSRAELRREATASIATALVRAEDTAGAGDAVRLIERLTVADFATHDDKLTATIRQVLTADSGPHIIVFADSSTSALGSNILGDLAGAMAAGEPAPVVVVAPTESALLTDVRSAEGEWITTIDHLETFAGELAVVLAVLDVPDVIGHYGRGELADSLVPGG